MLLLFIFSYSVAFAQVKIGDTGTPHSAAVLELESPATAGAGKGFLLPGVSITSTTGWRLSGTAVKGMTVYNNNASITGNASYPIITGEDVYYWDCLG